jgi:phosphatidylglycerophosphatase A
MRTLLLTCCGVGHSKIMPGTLGSLPVVGAVLLTTGYGTPWSTDLTLLILFAASAISTLMLGRWAERRWRRSDPGCVVSDEVAGQALTYLFVPWVDVLQMGTTGTLVIIITTGFVLFRLLDITKPPPIRGIQQLHGGVGILVDDLIAGLIAGGLTWWTSELLLQAPQSIS